MVKVRLSIATYVRNYHNSNFQLRHFRFRSWKQVYVSLSGGITVTADLYCKALTLDKRAESCKFFSAHVYLAPPLRSSRGMCDSAWAPNTGMVWLSGREKKFADMLSRLDIIHTCEGKWIPVDSCTTRLRIASRGNNWIILILILILYLKTRNRRA